MPHDRTWAPPTDVAQLWPLARLARAAPQPHPPAVAHLQGRRPPESLALLLGRELRRRAARAAGLGARARARVPAQQERADRARLDLRQPLARARTGWTAPRRGTARPSAAAWDAAARHDGAEPVPERGARQLALLARAGPASARGTAAGDAAAICAAGPGDRASTGVSAAAKLWRLVRLWRAELPHGRELPANAGAPTGHAPISGSGSSQGRSRSGNPVLRIPSTSPPRPQS